LYRLANALCAVPALQATEQQWMLQHNLLPLNVQRKLRNGETVIAESHPAATVLWAEVLGPTAAAASGMGAAVAAAAGSSGPLQEALKHISSQQQLAAAAAAAADQATGSAADAAADAAAGSANGVSRSGSLLGLSGLDVSGPLSLGGSFAPGLSPAEAVVRLNSLYTTWEELCAKQVSVLGLAVVRYVTVSVTVVAMLQCGFCLGNDSDDWLGLN
jgi:hypothetical protein